MAGHPLFAAAYDAVTAPLERTVLAAARTRVLAGAAGRVLEVGAGTGANLERYPAAVEHVDLCEPDPHMRRRLEARLASRSWPFTAAVHDAPATGPFPGDGYGAAVSTLVLCTVPDPVEALAAMRAALREGGRVRYLEHVRARPPLGWLQPALDPVWGHVAGGCSLTRDLGPALRAAGLVPVEQRWLELPPPLGLAVEGEAIERRRPPA